MRSRRKLSAGRLRALVHRAVLEHTPGPLLIISTGGQAGKRVGRAGRCQVKTEFKFKFKYWQVSWGVCTEVTMMIVIERQGAYGGRGGCKRWAAGRGPCCWAADLGQGLIRHNKF